MEAKFVREGSKWGREEPSGAGLEAKSVREESEFADEEAKSAREDAGFLGLAISVLHWAAEIKNNG